MIVGCSEFFVMLPFMLTSAQIRVMCEIDADLVSGRAMTRLVQGDVGCGKTVVALYAMYCTANSGKLAVMMAPTDIFAKQHYEIARRLLPESTGVVLVIGSQTAAERNVAFYAIESGAARIVIGIHALLYGELSKLHFSLVVIDEQHRFGVCQRQTLTGHGTHMFIMSATFIPRIFVMFIYGGWDISVIDEQSVGRSGVKMCIVFECRREAMYEFIREQAAVGVSVFVVCSSVAAFEFFIRSVE